MPSQKTIVAPLAQAWLDAVISLLERQEAGTILWTARAEREMSAAGLGFKHEAFELCLRVLRATGMLGEQIYGMVDESDNTTCETWAFLCPHPLRLKTPLYVKIALHGGRARLVIISMHTDDSGKLLQAIRSFLRKRK